MRLNPLSKVRPSSQPRMDTIKAARAADDDRARGQQVLLQAQACYMAMARFRAERDRNKRYTYGDQWSDTICYKGQHMTEEQYLIRQGNLPLKNNLIRRLVRNVIGVMRSQSTEPTCIARDRDEQKLGETMSTVLQYNMQLNRMQEINARTMEEFLISGLIVQKKWFGWRQDKNECWTDVVQPNNFFIDCNMRDFRGWDCTCLGEVHDVDFLSVCTAFAHSPADFRRLADIYHGPAADRRALLAAWDDFGYPQLREPDFLMPYDPARCRVIEVWRKEQKPRYRCHDYNSGDVYKIEVADLDQMVTAENARRLAQALAVGMDPDDVPLIQAEWFMDDYWYYYYLSPLGDILDEGETPYAHRSHPYVFMAYPMIDGEIHSFVADVIDQQKYTNRLIMLHDWIMRASAKGVLLVPEDCIPQGMSPEDFAESWSSVNGVVIYTPSKMGNVPQQVANNSTNIGIAELLNVQLKFFEDISGVNGALQGKPGYAGMSAALYNQQTQNATTSLLDILDCFQAFTREGAIKDVKNIQQFYDQRRVFNISGSQLEYDPDKIRDVEFDLSIVPSTATPAYRSMANEFLIQIWQSGQISLQQLLETGNFPFADRLLQSIQTQQEQLQQGQTPQGLSPELMAQAQAAADPAATAQLQQALTPIQR